MNHPVVRSAIAVLLAGSLSCGGGDSFQSFNLGPAGGVVSLAGGIVVLNVPAGAVAENVTVSATSVAGPGGPTVVAGTVFDLQPSLTFSSPVQVTIKYQGATLPTGVRASELGIYRVDGTAWTKLAASAVDTVQKVITASLTGFSVYGILGAPVASVAVTPVLDTIEVGATTQLTATPQDAGGAALTARAVSWSSRNTAVATVNGTGLVTGVAVGTDTIVVTAEGRSANAVIVVTAPPSSQYPNEPPGFVPLLNLTFDSKQLPGGWAYNALWGDTSRARVISDNNPTAGGSPPNALEIVFPQGFTDVTTPPSAGHSLSDTVRQLYVSFNMRVSNPWDYHSTSVNKLLFVATNGSGSLNNEAVIGLIGTTEANAYIGVGVQTPGNGGFPGAGSGGYFTPNVFNSGFSLGVWHRVEVLFIRSTGGATGGTGNGIIRWWVDGVLNGQHTNVLFHSTIDGLFNGFVINPNWGGSASNAKSQRDWIRFDHIYVSGLP